MLSITEIREYISNLGIAEDDRVYIGKLDNKKPQSIGVYSRSSSGNANIPLGGIQNSTYDIRPISLLVHWNKSKPETEEAAYRLYELLRDAGRVEIGSIQVNYIRMMVPEPQDVGTDDNGIYEYVIWLDFIYQKGTENE